MPSFQRDCLICGQPLEYFIETRPLSCLVCGQAFNAEVACQAGHYVCDDCHRFSPNDLIAQTCLTSTSTNPVALAQAIMASPLVSMHGPEHHFLVPAVLVSAYYNATGQPDEKARQLQRARSRAEKVPGGFCGSHGDCGAAVGTGIALSLISGATPLARAEWALANRMTAYSLLAVAEHGGPRCCKRNTYLALREAVRQIEQAFGVRLEQPERIACSHSTLNRECRGADCPYWAG
jgi:hypothetical protein